MMPFSNRLGRTAALIIAAGFIAHAAGDGNISVSVTNKDGKPLAGATVTITSPTQIGGAKIAVTDAEGRARFIRLSPGAFRVDVRAENFQTTSRTAVVVNIDQTSALAFKLNSMATTTVEVVAAQATVDVTSVTVGKQISDRELEILPVGRDQLSSMILVPGVLSIGGNPALTTGLNHDNFGGNGARNNSYLIDGIDVTSPESGTSRTQIAPELIQVQDVKTGAITAEYSARAGLFSSVTTKAGSNQFSTGISLYSQPSSFNGSVKDAGARGYDVGKRNLQDYTFWALGPIIKDKLWYLVSYQKIKDEVTVNLSRNATPTPGESRTGVKEDGYRLFIKGTWQITPNDLLGVTFNRNPNTFDNLDNPGVLTRRAILIERGGDRYLVQYSHQFGSSVFLDLRYGSHQEDNKNIARFTTDGPQNNIRSTTQLSALQSQLGDSAAYDKRSYTKKQFRMDATWLFDAAGSHTLKAGWQGGLGNGWKGEESLTQEIGVGQGAAYESYDLGIYKWSALPSGNMRNQRTRTLTAINGPNGTTVYAALIAAGFTPTGAGSTFTSLDLANYTFNEANPAGGFYSYRLFQQSLATSSPKMETSGFYVQDQWNIGRWNFNPGLRFDQYAYVADNGTTLFKTNYAFAPRVGLTYDVRGDGRSKIYAYFGRYIDPIKLDMVRFTGSLTSSVRTEDARIQGQWITFNRRGGSKTVDAVFADTFKLPKTDEIRIGYSSEFGKLYTFEATATYRKDFDIVEDWDPTLYTDAGELEKEARGSFGLGTRTDASAMRIVNAFRALRIDPSYFAGGGFTGLQNIERVSGRDANNNPTTLSRLNFVLANLPGGERKYKSLDLTFTRREANNWGGFASVSLVDAKGNSYSSGNADYQGDLAIYDPRLPYGKGKLDGSVNWLAKMNGYYHWNMGIVVGATLTANSGYHYTRGALGSGRILQSINELGGTLPGTVNEANFDQEGFGKYMTPKQYQLDLRVQYGRNFDKIRGEVFLDIVNATNNQNATDLAEGLNVRPGFPIPDMAYNYQLPRRFALGVRIKY